MVSEAESPRRVGDLEIEVRDADGLPVSGWVAGIVARDGVTVRSRWQGSAWDRDVPVSDHDELWVLRRGFDIQRASLGTRDASIVVQLEAAVEAAIVREHSPAHSSPALNVEVDFMAEGHWAPDPGKPWGVGPVRDIYQLPVGSGDLEIPIPRGARAALRFKVDNGICWPQAVKDVGAGVIDVYTERDRQVPVIGIAPKDAARKACFLFPDRNAEPSGPSDRVDALKWRLSPSVKGAIVNVDGDVCILAPNVAAHVFLLNEGRPECYVLSERDAGPIRLGTGRIETTTLRRVDGVPFLPGTIVAAGHLDLRSLLELCQVRVLSGAWSIVSEESMAIRAPILASSGAATVWDPEHGLAYIESSRASVQMRDFCDGSISIRVLRARAGSHTVMVWPSWRGSGTIFDRPYDFGFSRETTSDGSATWRGLPLGVYCVEVVPTDVAESGQGHVASAERRMVTLTAEQPSATLEIGAAADR